MGNSAGPGQTALIGWVDTVCENWSILKCRKITCIPHLSCIKCFVPLHFTNRCAPDPDLGIVAELQASGGPASEHDRHSLITRAWCKIPLFDNHGSLIAGRFRIPLRNVPIKPFLHVSQCQRITKVRGRSETVDQLSHIMRKPVFWVSDQVRD